MKLIFGVEDVPYMNPPSGGRVKKASRARKTPGLSMKPIKPPSQGNPRPVVTTAKVAQWLEDRYHIMELFYEENVDMINEAIHNSLVSVLRNLHAGSPASNTVGLGDATETIQQRFREFITLQEVELLGIPGVPTRRALEGRSLRFKNKRGPRRPSFYDTGLYIQSFRVWTE
jgi:hypothetical protein